MVAKKIGLLTDEITSIKEENENLQKMLQTVQGDAFKLEKKVSFLDI